MSRPSQRGVVFGDHLILLITHVDGQAAHQAVRQNAGPVHSGTLTAAGAEETETALGFFRIFLGVFDRHLGVLFFVLDQAVQVLDLVFQTALFRVVAGVVAQALHAVAAAAAIGAESAGKGAGGPVHRTVFADAEPLIGVVRAERRTAGLPLNARVALGRDAALLAAREALVGGASAAVFNVRENDVRVGRGNRVLDVAAGAFELTIELFQLRFFLLFQFFRALRGGPRLADSVNAIVSAIAGRARIRTGLVRAPHPRSPGRRLRMCRERQDNRSENDRGLQDKIHSPLLMRFLYFPCFHRNVPTWT
ncbi:MAG: hypothetical protein KF802_06735 [Bdellovibrionaceae bacterium]|nr:hypothetical protein [Pseudobdellovibrionaceae bacterium]